jgi:hypothetical protein
MVERTGAIIVVGDKSHFEAALNEKVVVSVCAFNDEAEKKPVKVAVIVIG